MGLMPFQLEFEPVLPIPLSAAITSVRLIIDIKSLNLTWNTNIWHWGKHERDFYFLEKIFSFN